MNKKNWTKVVFVVLFVILAGTFYSCRMNQKEEAILLLDKEEVNGLRDGIDQYGELSNIPTVENIDVKDNIKSTEEFDKGEVSSSKDKDKELSSNSGSITDEIYVYICGEVHNPDVYKVANTARVFEVIALAGGLTDAAAGEYINQALAVSDGQQIYIPSNDEVADVLLFEVSNESSNETTDSTNEVNKQGVNINTAESTELMTLSGIGQAKAQAIIEYRNNNGGFKTTEDIMQIDGIKEAVYNKIKDKIRVD